MAAPSFAGGGGADAAAAASSPPPTAAELGLPPWLDLCIVRGDNKLIASSREELSGRLKIRQLGGRADYPLGHIAHWAAKVVALVSGEDDGHSADYEGGGSEGDGSASAVDSLGAREEALLLLDDAVDLLDSEVEATRKEWGHPDDHSALIAYVTAYSHRMAQHHTTDKALLNALLWALAAMNRDPLCMPAANIGMALCTLWAKQVAERAPAPPPPSPPAMVSPDGMLHALGIRLYRLVCRSPSAHPPSEVGEGPHEAHPSKADLALATTLARGASRLLDALAVCGSAEAHVAGCEHLASWMLHCLEWTGTLKTPALIEAVRGELLPLLVGVCKLIDASLQIGGVWPTTLLPWVARPIAMAGVGTVVTQLGRAYAGLLVRPPSDRLAVVERSHMINVLGPPLSLACAVLELRAPSCQQLLGAGFMDGCLALLEAYGELYRQGRFDMLLSHDSPVPAVADCIRYAFGCGLDSCQVANCLSALIELLHAQLDAIVGSGGQWTKCLGPTGAIFRAIEAGVRVLAAWQQHLAAAERDLLVCLCLDVAFPECGGAMDSGDAIEATRAALSTLAGMLDEPLGAMPATAHNTCLAGAIASRASVALVVGALGAVTIERPESLDDGWDGGSRPEMTPVMGLGLALACLLRLLVASQPADRAVLASVPHLIAKVVRAAQPSLEDVTTLCPGGSGLQSMDPPLEWKHAALHPLAVGPLLLVLVDLARDHPECHELLRRKGGLTAALTATDLAQTVAKETVERAQEAVAGSCVMPPEVAFTHGLALGVQLAALQLLQVMVDQEGAEGDHSCALVLKHPSHGRMGSQMIFLLTNCTALDRACPPPGVSPLSSAAKAALDELLRLQAMWVYTVRRATDRASAALNQQAAQRKQAAAAADAAMAELLVEEAASANAKQTQKQPKAKQQGQKPSKKARAKAKKAPQQREEGEQQQEEGEEQQERGQGLGYEPAVSQQRQAEEDERAAGFARMLAELEAPCAAEARRGEGLPPVHRRRQQRQQDGTLGAEAVFAAGSSGAGGPAAAAESLGGAGGGMADQQRRMPGPSAEHGRKRQGAQPAGTSSSSGSGHAAQAQAVHAAAAAPLTAPPVPALAADSRQAVPSARVLESPPPPGGISNGHASGGSSSSPVDPVLADQEAELEQLLSCLGLAAGQPAELLAAAGAPPPPPGRGHGAAAAGEGGGRIPTPAMAGAKQAHGEAGGGEAAAGSCMLREVLTCPLTGQLMQHPVILPDGWSYERAAVQAWLAEQGTSPRTGQAVAPGTPLRPNFALRQLLDSL